MWKNISGYVVACDVYELLKADPAQSDASRRDFGPFLSADPSFRGGSLPDVVVLHFFRNVHESLDCVRGQMARVFRTTDG